MSRLTDDADAVDEVVGLTEAGRGNTAVLGVVQRDSVTDGRFETGHDRGVAHAELPDRRGDARNDRHRQLPFVRLTDPAPPGELLQDPRALSIGVVPRERQPQVQTEQDEQDHERAKANEPDPAARRGDFGSHRVFGVRVTKYTVT